MMITDHFNHIFEFIHSFLAVDQNSRDSQILLEHLALKDFKINICNNINMWDFEFKQTSKIITVFLKQFAKELISKAQVLELHVIFRSCEKNKNKTIINDFSNVLKSLCFKYRDFFNVDKTEQQPPHQPTDHAIELRSGTESLYMQTYNMFSAKLKALDKYLTKALAKS